MIYHPEEAIIQQPGMQVTRGSDLTTNRFCFLLSPATQFSQRLFLNCVSATGVPRSGCPSPECPFFLKNFVGPYIRCQIGLLFTLHIHIRPMSLVALAYSRSPLNSGVVQRSVTLSY